MVPSVFNPHVNSKPALTEAKVPAGGLSSPQQAMVLSVFTPHVWYQPALTDLNWFGIAGPSASTPAFTPASLAYLHEMEYVHRMFW
jgi:hypothetical protein